MLIDTFAIHQEFFDVEVARPNICAAKRIARLDSTTIIAATRFANYEEAGEAGHFQVGILLNVGRFTFFGIFAFRINTWLLTTLLNLKMPPLAVTDRLIHCEELKAAGNTDFKAGDHHAALRHYKKILLLLATFRKGAVAAPVATPSSKLSGTESDQVRINGTALNIGPSSKQVAILLTAANNNIAAVYVRLEDWPKAKRHAAAVRITYLTENNL